MRVSSAPVRPGDDSVSDTIGWSAGSNRVRIGSSISGGRSLRMPGDLVADLLRRLLRVLLEHELDDDVAEAVERARRHPVDAADAGDDLLDRLDDLALDDVGRRARIRDGDDDDRRVDLRELVGVELQQRDDAEDHERQHRDDGEDGPLDGGV